MPYAILAIICIILLLNALPPYFNPLTFLIDMLISIKYPGKTINGHPAVAMKAEENEKVRKDLRYLCLGEASLADVIPYMLDRIRREFPAATFMVDIDETGNEKAEKIISDAVDKWEKEDTEKNEVIVVNGKRYKLIKD